MLLAQKIERCRQAMSRLQSEGNHAAVEEIARTLEDLEARHYCIIRHPQVGGSAAKEHTHHEPLDQAVPSQA